MVFVNRSYGFDSDFPPIDGPRAPLADVLEIEDYCIDGSCYVLADNGQRKNTSSKADRGELIIEPEAEDEGDDRDADDDVHDPDMDEVIDEEEDEDEDEEEELIEIDDNEDVDEESYPELSNGRKGSEPVAEDSYDFSVMDTDKESGRKRKTPGKGVADKKKKAKK